MATNPEGILIEVQAQPCYYAGCNCYPGCQHIPPIDPCPHILIPPPTSGCYPGCQHILIPPCHCTTPRSCPCQPPQCPSPDGTSSSKTPCSSSCTDTTQPPTCIPPPDPPWGSKKLYGLGFQLFTMILGTTVTIPSVLVPVMGGGIVEKAEAIQASLFMTGIGTLLQTWFGLRLAVVMGGSQAVIIPAISIALATNRNSDPNLSSRQRYKLSERRMQGATIVGSFFQIVIGFSGLVRLFERYLSPLATVPLVTLTGLGLYGQGFPQLAKCVEIGLPTLVLLVFSTQFLPRMLKKWGEENVKQFAPLASVLTMWVIAQILTVAGTYDNAPHDTQTSCRTDLSALVGAANWIKIPLPFQSGYPIFNAGDALSLIAACFVATIESIGTFIATARYQGIEVLPGSELSRGIGLQGIQTLFNAVFGEASISYPSVEQAGLMGLTQVGSRRVVQVAAGFTLLFSVFGKLGAIVASIPLPIVAALNCVVYPYVASAGLEYIQFCNLKSLRSKFILGISLFMGISVPYYFNQYFMVCCHGPVHTAFIWFNDIIQVIFSSPTTVAILIAYFLDHTHSIRDTSTKRDNGMDLNKAIEKSEEAQTKIKKILRSDPIKDMVEFLVACFES